MSVPTIHSFTATGADGANPSARLTLDAAGDLIGTTEWGGSGEVGTVFEIAAGTQTVTTLYSFSGYYAANPVADVTIDSAGDIFGTTLGGGAYPVPGAADGGGTVFEIKAGTTVATTLHTFGASSTDGTNPMAGVTLDAAGDIFGTTFMTGLYGGGSLFEIKAGTTVATTLYNFNPFDISGVGSSPDTDPIIDGAGDIFGTTSYVSPDHGATADDAGTIFEIKAGTTTPVTVYRFTGVGSDGYGANGLTLDSSGDIFGSTGSGGSYGLARCSKSRPGQPYRRRSTASEQAALTACIQIP